MEYFKALENAKVVHSGSPHVDIQDFLEAIDKTIAIEHDVEFNRRVAEDLVKGDTTTTAQISLII
jgi:hypothetical protein